MKICGLPSYPVVMFCYIVGISLILGLVLVPPMMSALIKISNGDILRHFSNYHESDDSECNPADLCGDGTCERIHNTTCDSTNKCVTVMANRCICKLGYILSGEPPCQDIDECKADDLPCKPNGRCINSLGTFNCLCELGYWFTGSYCKDEDECQSASSLVCGNAGTCINIPGSYSCRCNQGFVLGGDTPTCVEAADAEDRDARLMKVTRGSDDGHRRT